MNVWKYFRRIMAWQSLLGMLLAYCVLLLPTYSVAFTCPTLEPECQCRTDSDDDSFIECRNFKGAEMPNFAFSDDIFEQLVIEYGHIHTIQERAFGGLRVKRLSLSNLRISTIESEAFVDLDSYVEQVDMTANRISDIPSDAFQHGSNVIHLSLAYNKLTSIREDYFSNLANIKYLYLYGNKISEIERGAFTANSYLRLLNLDSNKITHLEEGIFDGLSDLVELGLESNAISSISSNTFLYLTKLTRLNLKNNKIQELSSYVFESLFNLQYLNLEDNLMTDISRDVLPKGDSFRYAMLGGNPFHCGCHLAWMRSSEAVANREEVLCSTPSDVLNVSVVCFPLSDQCYIEEEQLRDTDELCRQLTTTTSTTTTLPPTATTPTTTTRPPTTTTPTPTTTTKKKKVPTATLR